MHKRLITAVGIVVLVAAACQGASTTPAPTTAPTAAPATQAPATAAPTEAPSATVAPTEAPAQPNLFDSTYPSRRAQGTAGGTVIYGDWQEANLFNPYYQGQVIEANITSAVFRGLVTSTDDFKYAVDLAADPAPTLANGGVVLGNGGDAMTVTWKLKDGQMWSDGTPITCDDIVATHNWIMSPDNTGLYGGTSGYEDITKIDCPSPTEVVMHFKNIYFDYLVLFPAVLQAAYIDSIPVKDQVAGKGWAATDMPKVPVSGPFKYDTITPGQELRLAKNPNWKNPLTGESAYLDAVVWKWYGDADAMIAGYKAGEVDAIGDLADGDLPKVQDLGDQVHPLDALQYEFLRPNWGKNNAKGATSPMADPAVRKALALATNKDEINSRLLGGNATIAWTNVSPFAWYYSEPTKTPFNLDEANAVLDQAGWVKGSDGIRAKDGVKLELDLCTTTRQLRQDNLALLSSWLKEIGVASDRQAGQRLRHLRHLQRVHARDAVRALARQLRRRPPHVLRAAQPAVELPGLRLRPDRAERAERRVREQPRGRPDPQGPQGHRRLLQGSRPHDPVAEGLRGPDRRGPGVLPQGRERRPAVRQELDRQPDLHGLHVERRRLVRSEVVSEPEG